MAPTIPSSFRPPAGINNNRLRISSFRSQLHTSNTHDTSGVAIDDADTDQTDSGLLMAVTDPDATRVYGEVEGDSDGEGDMGEEMDAEEAEDWSDAVDELDVPGADDNDDVFSTPLPAHIPLEEEHEPPLPDNLESGPSRPTSARGPFTAPQITVVTVGSPPRMSTASEPPLHRRSIEGLLPPPRMSADAIIEGREDGLTPSTSRSERQSRRRSFDPRTAIGKLGFMRGNRSTERLEQPPAQPAAPPPTTPTRQRGMSIARSRSPGRNTITDPTSVPPPPPLPAPTLSELGLQLKPVTPLLAAPNLGAVPTSGCLLSPGYLLLCHNEGLDVVPLYAPPAARAYALIRGVPFKSVLVMEMLGFLVAIAGRREGVRVYALSDIKRAIEVRMEVERQKESVRRKSILMEPALPLKLKRSFPRPDTAPSPVRPMSMMGPLAKQPTTPTSASQRGQPRTRLQTQRSHALGSSESPTRSILHRPSSSSISMVENGAESLSGSARLKQEKSEWVETAAVNSPVDVGAETESEDEGYVSVPGPSGARGETPSPIQHGSTSAGFSGRRRRPADLRLDSSERLGNGMILLSDPMPSPAPSMMSMREALATTPRTSGYNTPVTRTPTAGGTGREVISFVDMLMESRIPDLPPAGTTWPQSATFVRDGTTGAVTLGNAGRSGTPSTLSPSTAPMRWGVNPEASRSALHLAPPTTPASERSARRRWSLIGAGLFSNSPPPSPIGPPDSAVSEFSQRLPPSRPPSAPPRPPSTAPLPPRHSTGLVPRLLTTAFKSRSSSEPKPKKSSSTNAQGQSFLSANGRLEHIKLEGTKGAYLIKSVQTNRKSFLAILCGEDGKKVELFTGSSKSASLSLARTFILPDSPLSLELQVQGEDLAELFLIFSDSVFALEPASVRVRQVNIARAERRAARRRRDRERAGSDATELASPQQTPNTSTFVTPPAGSPLIPPPPYPSPTAGRPRATSTATITDAAVQRDAARRRRTQRSVGPTDPQVSGTESGRSAHKSSPATPAYTTFQQLSFSPTFPLGTLAEDWIIPPAYPSFVKHKQWLQTTLGQDAKDGERDVTQPPAEDLYNLWHGVMNSWPRRGSTTERIPPTLQEASKVSLEDYFLPPVSLLTQPAHYGPPCLFFCSRGGLSTAIVDHKGKSVLLDKFHWSSSTSTATKANHRRPPGLGEIQRVEAFDGHNHGAVLVAIRQSGLEAVDIADALLAPSTVNAVASPTPGSYSRRMNWFWDVSDPFPSNVDPVTQNGLNSADPRAQAAAKLNGVASMPMRSIPSQNGHDYSSNQHISYLGREGTRVYICTRSANMFRVVVLQSSVA